MNFGTHSTFGKALINAHIDMLSGIRGSMFGLSLHLHPNCVYASNESSVESAHMRATKALWESAHMLATKALWESAHMRVT